MNPGSNHCHGHHPALRCASCGLRAMLFTYVKLTLTAGGKVVIQFKEK
ncbi:MAG: hypothetical protein Q8P42_05035 [Gallionella sp.]|nr:hypothetical protein [Gallionella sp.]